MFPVWHLVGLWTSISPTAPVRQLWTPWQRSWLWSSANTRSVQWPSSLNEDCWAHLSKVQITGGQLSVYYVHSSVHLFVNFNIFEFLNRTNLTKYFTNKSLFRWVQVSSNEVLCHYLSKLLRVLSFYSEFIENNGRKCIRHRIGNISVQIFYWYTLKWYMHL